MYFFFDMMGEKPFLDFFFWGGENVFTKVLLTIEIHSKKTRVIFTFTAQARVPIVPILHWTPFYLGYLVITHWPIESHKAYKWDEVSP